MNEMIESSFKYRKILVPLDGSKLAEQALGPALAIAESVGARVRCLHVFSGLSPNVESSLNRRAIEAFEQAADLYLESLVERHSDHRAIIDVSTTTGPAAKTIVNYAKARAFDLIVMSSHGHTGLKRWVYGNVAIKILRRAPCDTLLIRPLTGVEPFSTKQILVPLDGSALGERALMPARALAVSFGAGVSLLRILPPKFAELEPLSSYYLFNDAMEPLSSRHHFDDFDEKARKEAQVYLQQVRDSLARERLAVTVATRTGSDAANILDYAEENKIDLIVMSSHGSSGVGQWLMGSVSEKVLRKANCATLIVRPAA